LGLSEIPWQGPVGAVRVGKVEGKLVLNPDYEQREQGGLDVVLVGTEKDGNILINMVEAKVNQVSEQEMLEIYDFSIPFIMIKPAPTPADILTYTAVALIGTPTKGFSPTISPIV